MKCKHLIYSVLGGVIAFATLTLASCSSEDEPLAANGVHETRWRECGIGEIRASMPSGEKPGSRLQYDPVNPGDPLSPMRVTWADEGEAFFANSAYPLQLPTKSYADNEFDFTIDWGDGKSENVSQEQNEMGNFTHLYEQNGSYTIKLAGKRIPCPIFQPTNVVAINDPLPHVNSTDFSYFFSYCSSLTTIPENLFANNPNATDFEHAFRDCTSLTSITENLFANNPKATYFWRTFSGCKSLTGRAPELWKRTNVKTHSCCFSGCTSLTNYADIPYDWKNV